MFGRKRKKTSSGRLHARFLKVERLESRQMLNGTVDIQIAPHVGVAAGNLAIVSTDASDESVKIQSTGQVNQYVITGENSTQLTVNEVPVTSPVTLGGISGSISVDLGPGSDTFDFEGATVSPPAPSEVHGSLNITNATDNTTIINDVQVVDALKITDGANNTTTISNSQLLAGLAVGRTAGSDGPCDLTITATTIVGPTVVDNSNAGTCNGDSQTTISGGSQLQGTFALTNGDGNNELTVNGTTAATQLVANPQVPGPVPTVVTIVNGSGGSAINFSGSAATPLEVIGGVSVTNGAAPGAWNIVNFNYANVAGKVAVDNDSADAAAANGTQQTQVTVNNSHLGTQTLPGDSGNSLLVKNGIGWDQFTMSASTAPWGTSINNDVGAAGASAWGSNTSVSGSTIGGSAFGPDPALAGGLPGDALVLKGDSGDDSVTLSSATVGGNIDLSLFGGNNTVNLTQVTTAGLRVATGAYSGGPKPVGPGIDSVTATGCTISNQLQLLMGGATNTVTLQNGTAGETMPDPYLGIIDIEGTLGSVRRIVQEPGSA